MPFKSEAQRGYMYANHPEIAKRFQRETPKGKKLPKKAKKYSDQAGVVKGLYGGR